MSDVPTRPRPIHTPESEPFWQSAREHRLQIQKCSPCGRFIHYPRTLCPTCFGDDLVWEPVSGNGVVLTWSVSHRAQHPSFKALVPFPIVVADMAEGFRMVANVHGIGIDELRPGLPVRVYYQDLEEDFTLPVFEHAERG
jgi:uncharacterized OB-fold protein